MDTLLEKGIVQSVPFRMHLKTKLAKVKYAFIKKRGQSHFSFWQISIVLLDFRMSPDLIGCVPNYKKLWNCRKHVEDFFSVEKMTDQYEMLYKKLIQARK